MSNNNKGATPQHPLDEWATAGWQQLSPAEATASRQRLQQRIQAQRAQHRPVWGKWMAVAASLILLLTAGQYFLAAPANDHLAASTTLSHFADPLQVGILSPQRSAEQPHAAKLLTTATATYQQGEFTKAGSLFKQYLTLNEKHVEVALFLGHAQLQYDPHAAKQTLTRFLNNKGTDQVLLDYANCFLAIAQIKTDEKETGLKTLEVIAADAQHPLQAIAQQELTKISN